MKGQETRGFQSEVKQLLHLMIHSLYSNKEIFLRELISNASDAADKLRFRALSQPDLYEGDGELRVRVSFDKDNRTLTIADNGIGMNREEVIDHLGTIAKSGTKAFLESMGSDQAKDSQLIGQFRRRLLFGLHRGGQSDRAYPCGGRQAGKRRVLGIRRRRRIYRS